MSEFRVTKLWAFLVVGPDGEEGVPAIATGDTREWMPLIAADAARLGDLLKLAREIAESQGIELQLAEFSVRKDLDIIKPTRRNN